LSDGIKTESLPRGSSGEKKKKRVYKSTMSTYLRSMVQRLTVYVYISEKQTFFDAHIYRPSLYFVKKELFFLKHAHISSTSSFCPVKRKTICALSLSSNIISFLLPVISVQWRESNKPPRLKSRDGIHQIVSRFLERFRYMCPLLFSCVFLS
jgi:hypothetical protein